MPKPTSFVLHEFYNEKKIIVKSAAIRQKTKQEIFALTDPKDILMSDEENVHAFDLMKC